MLGGATLGRRADKLRSRGVRGALSFRLAQRREIGDKRDSCEVRGDTCVRVRAGVRC